MSRYADELVMCLLRGGFSRVEQTLLKGGRRSSVIQQRVEFEELMRGVTHDEDRGKKAPGCPLRGDWLAEATLVARGSRDQAVPALTGSAWAR